MGSDPIPEPSAARALGEALRRVDYSEESVLRLLGDDAYSSDGEAAEVGERRLPRTDLGTVIRAFFLQVPVSKRDAISALGRTGVAALAATGLAEVAGDVVPCMRILPVGRLLVASDDYPDEEGKQPPDYVAAYTPTSRLLDSLTPRHRIGRALDVGTGSGVQALRAARHARHVVATDVNARALAYTELNAGLNGFANIECRLGSLFEPADGECFDLITCNAPYVVSPENRWAFRDGGFEADELSERVVRSAAEHLSDRGFATLLVSWVAHDEDEPDERPLAWTDSLGCDSWIIPIWGADPIGHAATWNDHLADEPDQLGDALDSWTRYLERLGVRWVSEGAVLLHRRAGRRHAARVDLVDEDDLEPAGDQIARAFEARERLSELARKSDLLGSRLSISAPLRLEHDIRPRRGRVAVVGSTIQVGEGTQSVVEASPRALEIVAGLDGKLPLEDVVRRRAERLGLSEAETSRLRREVLDVGRELLELGALRFQPA